MGKQLVSVFVKKKRCYYKCFLTFTLYVCAFNNVQHSFALLYSVKLWNVSDIISFVYFVSQLNEPPCVCMFEVSRSNYPYTW